MVLAESRHLVGRDWRILASDVDEAALDDARRAVFGRRAVAGVPTPLRERHMIARSGGSYALVDRLRERIDYRVVNLVAQPLDLPEAPFDLVFLRNVLIYFRPEQQRRVVRAVVTFLGPAGYLFLGPAESLWQLDAGLDPMDLGDCFCYRRPRAEGTRRLSAPCPGTRRTDPMIRRGEIGSETGVGPSLPPATCAREEPALTAQGPDLGPILSALEEGRAEPARDLVSKAIRRFPDNARLRVLEGLVAELEGNPSGAVRSFRAALYLDPRLFQARYLLARGLGRTGWMEPARRAYREALAMAEQGSPADEIPGTGRVGIPSTRQVIEECREALSQTSQGDGDPGRPRVGE
jgi:hypothetical protein